MNAPAKNDKLLISLLSQQASNRADAAGKMLAAAYRASSLEQARREIEEVLAQMQRVDELREEEYRLKQRV